MKSFAHRLRAARERHRYTHADLARLTGIHPQAISHYENGRREPNMDNLRALAVALGGSANYLLGLSASLQMMRPDGRPVWALMEKSEKEVSRG